MLKSFYFFSCCETGSDSQGNSCGCGQVSEPEVCGCGYALEDCSCQSGNDSSCGCGSSASECGCGGGEDLYGGCGYDEEEDFFGGCGCGSSSSGGCGCGSQEEFSGCGCGGSSSGGCGCGGGCGGSQRDAVLISFDDGTQYECPVLSIFDINEQEYIALYHPEKQRALLYRFLENSQGVMLETIEDEEEFELVANAFRNL